MINRNSVILLLATIACSATGADAAGNPSAKGTWMRGDGKARVEFGSCGQDLCATNVWIKDSVTQGEAVGDKLVIKVEQDLNSSTYTGTAFDPKRNLTVNFKMSVQATTMKTSGCVVGGLICKSERWTRVK